MVAAVTVQKPNFLLLLLVVAAHFLYVRLCIRTESDKKFAARFIPITLDLQYS